MEFEKIKKPDKGTRIEFVDGVLEVPDDPIIPLIEGDGIGPDVVRTAKRVIDAAVEEAYGGERKINWFKIYAGESANRIYGDYLPEDTRKAIDYYSIALKGPLTTPVGGGIRSLNVALRQIFDLYQCIRPVRYFEGVPSPMKHPEKLNVVIFRENTEDVYAGIEWAPGTPEAGDVIDFLNKKYNKKIRGDSGIGIKPISEFGSKRLVRSAINYAIDRNRESVTLVHKGNIMKFTEGAFKEWGYEVAKDEFPDLVVAEGQQTDETIKTAETGRSRILIKDRIADSMFQQLLLRPDEYDVIATTNLNGDYLSDACAAQVGGLGLAPGANIGDRIAIFEATHGTAPKYADQDKVNPGSIILSGCMMLEHIGWKEASDLIIRGMEEAIKNKTVTYDLHRQMEDATLLKCSEFGSAIVAGF